ncbi:sugar transferase [Halobacteria archaeon HArc-gm2]|nr:sugar transferase [Halobacteria archaeon HArc-gm2]
MGTGLRYRILAVAGAIALTAVAISVANHPFVQTFVTSLPVLENLKPVTKTNGDLIDEIFTTSIIILAALWPLFKPQPRRILDAIALTHKRTFLAATALATIGYFDWSTRLPRTTLITTVAILGVVLPIWFVTIRRRPLSPTRAVIVGDDRATIERLYDAAEMPILGYVSPATVTPDDGPAITARVTDGGVTTDTVPARSRLGGLAKLENVLVEHDVDTVLLAFDTPDREEFFGTLATCHRHGVRAFVHRDHADRVLVAESTGEELVNTDLEPWDWQDYAVKRLFDAVFAATGIVLLAPVMVLIAVAIKLGSPGPILYSQRRTAEFGETFTVYKFRTMTDGKEDVRPSEDGENHRITRIGRVLRKTHLDEIPQLFAILKGDMSVVGPRAVWTDEEHHLEQSVSNWRKRWFVKPGLTGLAQINGVSSTDPDRKLRYDIEYIRQQSFWFDLKIVTRQIYGVVVDAASIVFGWSDEDEV